MSRLYLALQSQVSQELSPPLLRQVQQALLDSHLKLADCAYLRLRGEVLLSRPALVSPLNGGKDYPFNVSTHLYANMFHVEPQAQINYSSTCPYSTALVRQLIQQQLAADFVDQPLSYTAVLAWLGSTQDQPATPHSQRNRATLQVRLDAQAVALPLLKLIERAERELSTAVQTAVKRADEQLFALDSSGPASTYLGMFKHNLDTLPAALAP